MSSAASLFLPLCQLPVGECGRVRELTGDASFCQRIREIGFVEAALVRKVGGTGPFLCQVNENRVALGHGAAASILVERLAGSAAGRARIA